MYTARMNIVRAYHYVVYEYTSRRLYHRCIVMPVTGYVCKHQTARHSPRLVAIVSRLFFHLLMFLVRFLCLPNTFDARISPIGIFPGLFLCAIRNKPDACTMTK